jgi:NTE family protein
MSKGKSAAKGNGRPPKAGPSALPGQIVLVLQGGGALGAYQAGVYQALHQSGIAPDWVIGTSIGAINGALIAGNAPEHRLERLHAFWDRVQRNSAVLDAFRLWPAAGGFMATIETVMCGIPGFFAPNVHALLGTHMPVGVEAASYYNTSQLRETLSCLIDFDLLAQHRTRLTVGAVNVRTGAMRYFDSRDTTLSADHVMASGALPPAFPAVRIDGEPYWDGGIYSNTPLEAVLDDKPRRDSVIFTVNVWRPNGDEPDTLWRVMGRHKDIQFASRADSHIARQKQIHHLRHVIRELSRQLPAAKRESAAVKELSSWGCGTTMHVVRLLAPPMAGEDHTKDIDFTAGGLRARWSAGYADTLKAVERAPWTDPADPIEGVILYEQTSGLTP